MSLAARLILANIGTIGELHQRVRTRGYRWWVAVPRLGEKGANAWWPGSAHESSLGVMTPQGALTTAVIGGY